ncbi:MAG: amidohydrolase family protein [Acidobacteriaceae bacterium]|nr:amidohydrolase family protein [Acidobacteriaceae bacterium]
MNRRTFLGGLAALGPLNLPAANTMPIVDTHIHLFDTRRPQGVPWPPKDSKELYRPALPERYRELAVPHGITAAIEVEASPWVEDNQWVLDIAAKDKIIVGTVGNLEPDKPDYRKQLERFHRNPLFLGIRYGNLWDRDIHGKLGNSEFVAGLKELAEAGLVLDTANPTPQLMDDMVRVSDLVPSLRIILDHVPQIEPPKALHELAKRPHVYVKVSGVLRRVDGRVPQDLAFYKPRLDQVFEIFGEDRVLYGSDWPNSDQWGPYSLVFRIVHEYFTAKGPEIASKYFWKNSMAAYHWKERS